MSRHLRFLGFLSGLLGMFASGCALPERAGHGEEGDADEVDDRTAERAVTYADMRLTPRGSSSGLEWDLEPMRRESASDKIFFDGAEQNIDLERRALLRAFEGAPPVIPHSVQQSTAPECLACHGARLQFRGRAARTMSHDERTNCTSCHVMSTTAITTASVLGADPRAVENSFVGLRNQVTNPTAGVEPPPIPHRTAMRERCAACHGQNGPGAGHHPVDFQLERELPTVFALSPSGQLTCRTCHAPSSQLPAFSADATAAAPSTIPTGSQLCLSCHEASHEPVFERLGLSGGRHPGGTDLDRVLSERVDTRRPGCLGCHGTKGALEKGVLRDAGEGRACAVCHVDQAGPERNHPVNTAGARKTHPPADVPVGDGGAPICRSCHDLKAGTGEALVRSVEGGQLCMSCHDDRQQAMKGAHGKAGTKGREACFGCHKVHGADRSKHLLATASRATASDRFGCLACHGPGGSAVPDKARPGAAGHPVDGRAHAGMDDTLTCVSCHDAHDPDPSEIDCTTCHGDKGADFARGGHGKAACFDCHPAHSAPASAAIVDANPTAQRCLACHDAKLGRKGITSVAEYTHPATIFKPGGARWQPLGTLPLFGANGKPVAANLNGDLTCPTCHTTHGPDATHPADKLRRPGWQGVCSVCHGDDALLVYRYFHERAKLTERQP